jgi:hypothetical protein
MGYLLRPAGAAFVSLAFLATVCEAAPPAQGRWEGEIQIPGAPLVVILDLAKDSATTWKGSVIMPGLGVKGSPVSDISVSESRITLELSKVMASGDGAPAPRIKAWMTGADAMSGEFVQGGNTAVLKLKRVGPAQVEPAPKSTAVAGEFEGTWVGRYEMDGYPREVTLTLSNHPQAAATADLKIVGRQAHEVPVDLVVQDAQFLRIEAGQARIAFEGQWHAQTGEMQGSIQVGANEAPLVLRHATPTAGGKS